MPQEITRAIPVVIMLDPIVHDDAHPYCDDQTCPCRADEELHREYIVEPYARGVISLADADRIYKGRKEAKR